MDSALSYRTPVSRAENRSNERSASTSPPHRTSSEGRGLGRPSCSEPGSPELDALKDYVIPLQDIKAMVRRIQEKDEKRRRENARRAENRKKKKRERASEREEKLQLLRDNVSNIRSAVEAEENEIRGLKLLEALKTRMRRFARREGDLCAQILDELLVQQPEASARSDITVKLDRLQQDMANARVFLETLRNLHQERIQMLRNVVADW
ncbi:hypothetical protein CDD83_1315 [Cordyceps sp. RAO-2017]|nr:hypothetical protein CDD83_1315 [Cordyceps sp. RAO-2017]